MLNKICANPHNEEEAYNFTGLIFEESNKLSNILITLLQNDDIQEHFVSKGIL